MAKMQRMRSGGGASVAPAARIYVGESVVSRWCSLCSMSDMIVVYFVVSSTHRHPSYYGFNYMYSRRIRKYYHDTAFS
eukprot:7387806-Prymnesium_polylepis.1